MRPKPAARAGFFVPGGAKAGSVGWERTVLWSSYLWIAVGSALGGSARFACSGLIAHRIGEAFPWGTLVVNIAGCFVIGFFGTLTGPDSRFLAGSTVRQFVMVGICGGFTTFSSFSLQTVNMTLNGELLHAVGNINASVALCVLATWVGHIAAAALAR